MPNIINPMVTNLTPTGKTLELTGSLEFDLGLPTNGEDRKPLVSLASSMTYDQCIPFSLNVEAAQTGKNLWEADSVTLRAKAVIVVCRYGGGGILINPDGDPLPFPLTTVDPAEPAWLMYTNPSGGNLAVTVGGSPDNTGPGIQKITVDTENESRFDGYVFV